MKVILTASRNSALDRPAFFRHLRHVHWPLVSSFPGVLREIRRYEQNHSFLSREDGGVPTPWRRAEERDSVIEVWFDGLNGLQRMDANPDYVAHVRPDEDAFNHLPSNVVLLANERVFHDAPPVGRVKRFDFLYRSENIAQSDFNETCLRSCEALSLDPLFQALADRLSLHLPISPEVSSDTQPDAVLAVTASGLEPIGRLADHRFAGASVEMVDRMRSFSVLATSFPVHEAAVP